MENRKSSSNNIEEQLKKLKDITLLQKEVDKLNAIIRQKDNEIAKLRNNLGEVSPLSSTSEETIARTQLALLEQQALIRPLSLEEVRIYDLLVKNLRLSTDKSTDNVKNVLPLDITKDELLRLAQTNVKSEKDE